MPDIYANIAHIQVTESANNTLTYKKLETGISLFEKVAWVLVRLEYYWRLRAPVSAAKVEMGISTSNNPAAIEVDEVAFVDVTMVERLDLGTPGEALIWAYPIIRDFAQLPGGGIIVPPNPLYLAVKGTSQTETMVVDVRMYYTVKQLKGDEFWELVEARRMISST